MTDIEIYRLLGQIKGSINLETKGFLTPKETLDEITNDIDKFDKLREETKWQLNSTAQKKVSWTNY